MKKFIQKILFLLLLFFVIIQIPKWILPPFWGNEIYDSKLRYLEQKDTITVLFQQYLMPNVEEK